MIPPDDLAAVERGCQWEHHEPGSWLFERGQETSHVYFVIEGTVRVLNYSSSGRVVRFASVGPGGLLGELSAMDGLPRSATVVA
ncbi:MAG: cyclic nucleotide-binding domain-containing protein, partial [Alphaproteobacteria bacterium]|nr:cyclic nucleotide-binding domain-containing protein [Alphaproteobacteria bacterium]